MLIEFEAQLIIFKMWSHFWDTIDNNEYFSLSWI